MTQATNRPSTLRIPPLPGGYGRSSLVVGREAPRVVRGSGYEVVDEVGRTLVDLNANFTVSIHGHGHPTVVAAARAALDDGVCFGLPNAHELAHARALLARLPQAEQVRYTNSGTEAVMTAIRVARASTGRERVVLVEGAYHGTSDVALPSGGQRSRRGVPRGVLEDVLVVPLNDVAALTAAVKASAESLAAVVLDLLPNKAGLQPVSQPFARAARELTRRVEAFLIVDEVISFRLNYGGRQEHYGVDPDLTVLGKIIGGGFPIGAVTGPARAMAVLDPFHPASIEHGGTFSANPVSMRAGLAALELLDARAVEDLNALGDALRDTLAPTAVELGWELRGAGSLLRLVPLQDEAATRQRALWWAAYERGLLLMPTGLMCLSTPMTKDVVEHVARELVHALDALAV